jgi:signal transduction histidine kinase/CheY-like chemotaxis protein
MKNVLKFWNKSLMARLVGSFFFLLLLTISLVGYLVYIQATRSLTQSVFDRLNAVATLKEDGLTRWVEQQRLYLVFIAWQPVVRQQAGDLLGGASTLSDRQATYAKLSDYLRLVVTSTSDTGELFILDLNGKVIVSTERSHEGQSQAHAPFFLLGRTTTYMQPVYTSPDTFRPTITIATPLFDENTRRVGVLAGHLNLARVDRIILERTGLGSSGETYLVNTAHDFVSAALFNNPALSKGGDLHSQGIDNALQGNKGEALYTNYQGIPVIGVYSWVSDQGVALIAEMSQEEAFAPARQLAWTILEFGLLSSLGLAVVVYLLARRIARPILAITATATRVAVGDLTQTAPVITEDEVGVLARAFNDMIGQLRLLYEGLEKKVAERTADLAQVNALLQEEVGERKRAEVSLRQSEAQLRNQNGYLAALHDTSLGLIGRLDLQDLFENLVTRAGQLMGTPNGFIYIAEPSAAEIECKVGVGIFSRLVGFRVPSGEGLGGFVWETGEPLVVDNYDDWPGRAKNLEKDLIRSIIGIPLKSGTQVVGVIGLAYDCQSGGSRTFGDSEVELLSRFAQLASIALDNARLYTSAKEARAAAEAANESKSVFLANVSHELRTPLTSILGFARIVQKRLQERIIPLVPRDDDKAQRVAGQVDENLQIILSEGERLTVLINDLLDLEKIRAGKMTWNMETAQIADILHSAVTATYSLFETKGLSWLLDISPDLPNIYGDRDRLVQVVINLISNAVKFTKEGTITCQARAGAGEIIVSVIDQGIGIAMEDQALVFEKFKQVGSTQTNKPKGTGLGLSICKEIIEVHGGRIWVESEPGKGSTFSFSLPVRTGGDQAGERRHPEEPLGENEKARVLDLQELLSQLKPKIASVPFENNVGRKTILVVDDDVNIRRLLREELEAERYLVYEAENGHQALAQVKQARPDLILLDILMPEMNGFDVAAVLKNDPETMNLPIMVVSILQDRERGFRLGIDRYLVKPIDIPTLLGEVQSLLANGPARKKVLVVDEDIATIQMLSEALIAHNYQVTAAYNSAEGLEKALAVHPDLIIINALLSEKHKIAQVLRFEKGLENIIFLLFR